MKTYPSIPRFPGGSVRLHTFDKLDGSNLRFEWSKKRGWFKFGTRKRLFDETDPQFGEALPLFFNMLAEPLERIAFDQKWQKVVVFAEFYGDKSFAGCHEEGDQKTLTVFDVSPHQRGILTPREFLRLFEEFGPTYLGEVNWTKGFVDCVRTGQVNGITFEGVVGKTVKKKQIVMYKAKTQQWIDKVFALYDLNRANDLVNS